MDLRLKKKTLKSSSYVRAYIVVVFSPFRFGAESLSNCRNLCFVQAETDVITDQWFYLVTTWRLKSGLSMYINGKLLAQDKGGVGVQNMKDWTQQENFFLGRNIGGTGQFFGNFYTASLVVFNSYLEAPAVYSVSKYYSKDGKI